MEAFVGKECVEAVNDRNAFKDLRPQDLRGPAARSDRLLAAEKVSLLKAKGQINLVDGFSSSSKVSGQNDFLGTSKEWCKLNGQSENKTSKKYRLVA